MRIYINDDLMTMRAALLGSDDPVAPIWNINLHYLLSCFLKAIFKATSFKRQDVSAYFLFYQF